MAFVIVENNQSVWDIAVQVYGDYSGVKQMMLDNPGVVNFSDVLAAGTKLVMNGAIINKNIVDYLSKEGIKPATGLVNIVGDGGFDEDGFSEGFSI